MTASRFGFAAATRLPARLGLAAVVAALAGAGPAPPRAQAEGTLPAATYVGAATLRVLPQGACTRSGRRAATAGCCSPPAPRASAATSRRARSRCAASATSCGRTAGEWFIRESYLTGRPRERRVDYTLGNRRIQHYLTRLEDGRIVVLPPSWDVQRREWFHNLDIVDLEESGGTRVQVWNAHCHGCHVSGQERNFRAETRHLRHALDRLRHELRALPRPRQRGTRSRTRAPGTSCARAGSAPRGETAVCAQCHSLRDVVAAGFVAGAEYADHFMPILEYAQKLGPDPAYWADGRPRRFSNDALGLWQSDCFVKGGVTCLHCHDPHEPDVDRSARLAASDGLCLGLPRARSAATCPRTRAMRREAPAARASSATCRRRW